MIFLLIVNIALCYQKLYNIFQWDNMTQLFPSEARRASTIKGLICLELIRISISSDFKQLFS